MEGTFPRSTDVDVRPSIVRMLVVSVAIAVALIASLVVLVPALTGPGSTTTRANTSYDQVEKARILFGVSSLQDSSYDNVEGIRLQVVLPNSPADHSYDVVERLRSQVGS